MRLRGKIDDDAALRLFRRGLDDAVEPFVSIDDDRRGEVRVETEQRAV